MGANPSPKVRRQQAFTHVCTCNCMPRHTIPQTTHINIPTILKRPIYGKCLITVEVRRLQKRAGIVTHRALSVRRVPRQRRTRNRVSCDHGTAGVDYRKIVEVALVRNTSRAWVAPVAQRTRRWLACMPELGDCAGGAAGHDTGSTSASAVTSGVVRVLNCCLQSGSASLGEWRSGW